MSDEQVQWQETILHTGTVEEREAAFAAFLSNKNGQHFVHGGPRADSPQAKDRISSGREWPTAKMKPKGDIKTPAQFAAEDLARRLQESRDRRRTGLPARKTPTPVKPDPSPVTEAERALKAFMGHGS